MVCSNCGKELPEGAAYCDNCGADIDTPVVLKATKVEPPKETRLKAEGPFINSLGFIKSIKDETAVLIGMIAAIIFYLSPFFSWIWENAQGEKIKASLFDLGGNTNAFGTGNKIIVLCAILAVLCGFMMILMTASENVRPLRPYSDNMLIRMIPVILAVVIFVIMFTSPAYKNIYAELMLNVERAERLGVADKFNGGRGLGPVFYVVGTIMYAISVFVHKASIKK